MVGAIFDAITSAVSAFVGTLSSGLTSIMAIFYDSTSTSLTVIGTLAAIVVGVGLVYWLFRLVMGLIRLRG